MRSEPRVQFLSEASFRINDKSKSGVIDNLSLKAVLINVNNCPPENSLVDLTFMLPSISRPIDVAAKVNRVNNGGFVAEFVSMDSTDIPYVWSIIRSQLTSADSCPYCGTSLGDKRPHDCSNCGYPLCFDHPSYFEKRDVAIKKKYLFKFISNVPDGDVQAIYDLIKKRFLENNNNAVLEEEDDEMVGVCDKMKAVFHLIRKVATVDVPVLIVGETGTGKEMAAKAIHERSFRANKPFIPINCGAIPKNLLESELFGYEKGAFTGADKQVKGRIEYAAGGTLFLDAIGELPLSLQVKILRFLEDYKIERVGGRKGIDVDLRVIAATNRDLEKDVAEGRFREDLYYRLNVVRVRMPSLHERGDDIVIMAKVFLRQYAGKLGKNIKGFTREALIALKAHHWPGNVRELINRIRRGVVMAEQQWITPENLELINAVRQRHQESLKEATKRFQRELVNDTIDLHSWKITEAAKDLKVSRSDMYYIMKKLGIDRKSGVGVKAQDGEKRV
ncbi:MAG: sigma 54-interacting transcriptional regulator [Desulfobacterales bacterium]|nr:sigma 54-interacting transcriptional regulator [Desulfobacterales bacterium]